MNYLTPYKFVLLLTLFFLSSFNYSTKPIEEVCEIEEETAVSVIRICNFDDGGGFLPNVCGGGQWQITMDNSNCTGSMHGKTFIANLTEGIPQENTTYHLPDGMPDIYIKYSILTGIPKMSGPYNTFVYRESTNSPLDDPGFYIFESDIIIEIDLEGHCSQGPGSITQIPIEISMVDKFGNIYPVDSYADPDDVYSCQAFVETCLQCENLCPVNEPEPIYNGTACGVCNQTCDDPIFSPEYSISSSQENKLSPMNLEKMEEDIELSSDHFSVQPNPFSNNFSIQYEVNEPMNIIFEVFDIQGTKVLQTPFSLTEKTNSIEIEASNFTKGIYFCKIQTPQKTITEKIIKLE